MLCANVVRKAHFKADSCLGNPTYVPLVEVDAEIFEAYLLMINLFSRNFQRGWGKSLYKELLGDALQIKAVVVHE